MLDLSQAFGDCPTGDERRERMARFDKYIEEAMKPPDNPDNPDSSVDDATPLLREGVTVRVKDGVEKDSVPYAGRVGVLTSFHLSLVWVQFGENDRFLFEFRELELVREK